MSGTTTQTVWGYLEPADFWKLREVSLTYALPDGIAARFRADGTVENIDAAPAQTLRDLYRRYYRPDNAAIVYAYSAGSTAVDCGAEGAIEGPDGCVAPKRGFVEIFDKRLGAAPVMLSYPYGHQNRS